MVRTELAVRVLILAAIAVQAGVGYGLEVQPLPLPNTGPAAQPHLAVDAGRARLVLSWQARVDDGCAALRAAEWNPASKRFAPVREIASGCDWFVNWADIPSLLVTDNGDWLAHWLQRSGAGTYAYDIRLSRSRDRGRTWSAAFSPHSDGTPTQHGFVSMAPIAGGSGDRALLVWLDGRNTASDSSDDNAYAGHQHHGHDDGMSLRSAIVDGEAQVSDEVEIDGRVCSCCPTGLLRLDDDSHLAIYRDRSMDEVRDMAFAHRGSDGWRAGIALHHDGWSIAGCPVNGPAFAARGDQVLAAWSTMAGDDGLSVRYRLVSNAAQARAATDETGFELLEGGARVLGRVSVAALPGGWLLAWLGAGDETGTTLRVAHLDEHLREQARIDIADLPAGRDIGLPRLAALGRDAVLAWTELDGNAAHQDGQRRPTRLRAVHLTLP